ncbi:hypothetical protein EDD11_000742 [Mortierella claussenii]|nr:hypothetical protein EDD11_000742 [Mortierella claussenii]
MAWSTPSPQHGAMASRPHPLGRRGRLSTASSSSSFSGPLPAYTLATSTEPAATTSVSKQDPFPLPYTPPTTAPHHPLDIPEILARVGQFVPLWVKINPDSRAYFYPQTLVRCTAVSRHWRSVMSPILWFLFDDNLMSTVPRLVAHRNAHFIRVLTQRHVYGNQRLECRNLLELVTSPWVAGTEELLKENPRLKKFSRHTKNHYKIVWQFVYDAMTLSCKRLTELEFRGCELDMKQLAPLLQDHLPSLRVLTLQDLDILPMDPMVLSVNPPQFTQIREMCMGMFTIKSAFSLVDMVRYCPNLERMRIVDIGKPWNTNSMSLLTKSSRVIDPLITNLSKYCLNL